ncbi:MAG: stage V sporulation protein AD [Bacillota bacterium]
MAVKLGQQTWAPGRIPVVIQTGTVVGPTEGEGPLRDWFDHIYTDPMAGERSFEQAEKEMMLNACYTALHKAGKAPTDVDFFLAGDLLNQIITSGFAALALKIPFLGLYGACSTSAESLAVATALVDAGFAGLVLCAVSSHNSTAERQYRYPTEYGSFRKPTAQWTVTGAGAALVAAEGYGPRITHVTVGTVEDYGVKDPFNLGAAMAPAAATTLARHFADTGRSPDYYDLIVTGDLGSFGHRLLLDLVAEKGGFDLTKNSQDCGVMTYDGERQDVHAGGSGCACSAVVVFGYLYRQMLAGKLRRVLLCATGALHSPTSVQQGENIPVIAHAVSLEM